MEYIAMWAFSILIIASVFCGVWITNDHIDDSEERLTKLIKERDERFKQ